MTHACSFRQYERAFSTRTLNNLPWENQPDGTRMLDVTMPDRSTDMRITQRESNVGAFFTLATVQDKMNGGATWAASQKIPGHCAPNRVTEGDLRVHDVRIILGKVAKLKENREAERTQPREGRA